MIGVKFEQTEDGNQFTFKDESGVENYFEYMPSIEGLWSDLDPADFDVQLLIHPFLNKESNVFALESTISSKEETVGFLFPVVALDSDNFEVKRPSDNNYFFVAYRVLLERLKSINTTNNTLGSCFESNVCVCVLNLRTIGRGRGLWNCIHSLRKKGYAYFVENNRYKEVEGYTFKDYRELIPGSVIHVEMSIPAMYTDPIIDGIIRSLPNADNLVYRFLLLYQIVEFLISKETSKSINEAISIYRTAQSSSENDFIESISNVRRERRIITEILKTCGITATLDCNKAFNSNCRHLYDLAGFVVQNQDRDSLFYSFRNQIVHSFRHLSAFKEELAHTLFYYEQIVLTIVEQYPFFAS